MKSRKLPIILTAIILVVVVCAMLYVYHRFAPQAQAGDKHITITIRYDDGTEKIHELDTDAAYLREALAQVAEIDGEESAEYGYTLYAVDGVTTDFTSSYWAIYVNDDYGAYNLADQPVADGEHYTIAYEQFQF